MTVPWERIGSYSSAALNNLFELWDSHWAMAIASPSRIHACSQRSITLSNSGAAVIPSPSRIHTRYQPSITFLNPGNLTGPLPSQAHLGSSWCTYKNNTTRSIYRGLWVSTHSSIRTCSVSTSSTSPILYTFSKSPLPNYHRSNPQRLRYTKKRAKRKKQKKEKKGLHPFRYGVGRTYFWKVQTTSTVEGGATSTCVFDVSFFPSSCMTFGSSRGDWPRCHLIEKINISDDFFNCVLYMSLHRSMSTLSLS